MQCEKWRKSYEPLLPLYKPPASLGKYDPYPAFPVGASCFQVGYDALARALAQQRFVLLDGEVGVFWNILREQLQVAFQRLGISVRWHNVAEALKPAAEIERLLAPFIGNDDPVFGRLYDGRLADFFDVAKLATFRPDPSSMLTIVYGCGAALVPYDGYLVFVEVPKNEVQARARAGQVANLGATAPTSFRALYKRLYFVDWVVLRKHKKVLLNRIALFVDAQRPETPVFVDGQIWRQALKAMSQCVFRTRPWFLPGPWGGQWLKRHLPFDTTNVSNYAWSYELIAPENGVLLESDGILLECAFDWLMFCAADNLLGEGTEVFGDFFPIRFDYLDTYDGGPLSIQCHPRLPYIRQQFGERWTQDEAYYIVDSQPDACVYLGLQASVDLIEFKRALERSERENVPVAVEQFVQKLPAKRHDFFLIPSGTVHAAGKGNLVLEISATPYLYTFKLYDWLRPDLDGGFRPLHLDHAFANIIATRKGERVREELVCRPQKVCQGDGWQLEHLPTHPEHFYDVFRLTFIGDVMLPTAPSCLVGNLVEGQSVVLETERGFRFRVNYAETFVIPAAAQPCRVHNESDRPAKIVWAQLKPMQHLAAWR
ncbi:putative mannose-6-phosphate isomerase GmuF [bacterium HR17]|uniref:Putative mannose-6-phosphate isomerase GmuF n=1 Tax=Candidatus Fervidibacter japonicus TaxID=2035412 RepID=A0A2H5XAV4_9BACT|nr:putative mannose-6-phosphate isomerase GmuF [bacterium HR17]